MVVEADAGSVPDLDLEGRVAVIAGHLDALHAELVDVIVEVEAPAQPDGEMARLAPLSTVGVRRRADAAAERITPGEPGGSGGPNTPANRRSAAPRAPAA